MCNFEENSLDCRDIPSFVVTLIQLCREKDWFSLLEIAGNYVATYFLCRDINLLEHNELCHDIILLCRDRSSKNPK